MKVETQWMNYTDLRRTVYRYREQFPFASFAALGRSWNGRALFSLKLGNQTDAVILIGGFDGRDALSPRLLLRFFEKLCRSYAEDAALSGIHIRSVFQDKGVVIVPCVNPDGLELKQAVNAHGVNPAENFKPHWAERKRLMQPDDDAWFGGRVPESEPETRALLFACRRTPLRHMMVLGQGRNTLTVYAPDCPQQRAEMMQRVLCAVGGFAAEPPAFLPGYFCGAAEQFVTEFHKPAFFFGVEGSVCDAEARTEEALVLSCLM